MLALERWRTQALTPVWMIHTCPLCPISDVTSLSPEAAKPLLLHGAISKPFPLHHHAHSQVQTLFTRNPSSVRERYRVSCLYKQCPLLCHYVCYTTLHIYYILQLDWKQFEEKDCYLFFAYTTVAKIKPCIV